MLGIRSTVRSFLRDWLFPEAKSIPTDQPWLDATISPIDRSASRYGSLGRSDAGQLLNRLTSTFMNCVVLNATSASSVTLRLYRPAGSGSRRERLMYQHRRIDNRRQKAWLRNPLLGKAASMADAAGEVEEITDHPVLDLLKSPQPGFTGIDFRMLTHMFLEATGRAFWQVVQPERSLPTKLLIMASQYTRVVPGTERLIDGFVYGKDPSTEHVFADDEVVYLRHLPSPYQAWGAIGWAHAILSDSDLLSAAVESELNRWQTGAQPDFWVTPKEKIGEAQAKQMSARIKQETSGVRKRQNFLVGDATVTPLGLSTKDMQYIEGQTISERRIRNAAGIPESMADLNAANLASATTSTGQYQRFTILPRVSRLAEQLTEELLPYYATPGAPAGMWFAPDNPVVEDLDAESVRHDRYLRAGVITINEVRGELGYDPAEGEEADTLLFQGVPLDRTGAPQIDNITDTTAEVVEEPKALPPTPVEDVQATMPNGAQMGAVHQVVLDAAAGEMPLDTARAELDIFLPNTPPDKIERLIGTLVGFEAPKPEPALAPGNSSPGSDLASVDGGGGDPPESGGETKANCTHGHSRAVAPAPSSLRALWAGVQHKDDDKIIPPSEAFRQALVDYFTKWQPEVIGRIDPANVIRDYLNGDGKALDDLLAVMNKHTERPLLLGNNEAALRVASHVGTEAADIDAWNVPPTDAIDFLRDRNSKAATEILKGYDDTVRARVADAIGNTLEAGQVTPAVIQQQVAAALPDVHKSKAEIIATTETQRAYTEGARNAYDSSEFVEGYDWVLSGNPCELCIEMSKRTAGKGEPFLAEGDSITLPGGETVKNDYGPMNGPPAHPRCACILEPRFKTK